MKGEFGKEEGVAFVATPLSALLAQIKRIRGRLVPAASVAFRHAHPAEHLGRGLELHGRDDCQQTEHYQGEDDELLHGGSS